MSITIFLSKFFLGVYSYILSFSNITVNDGISYFNQITLYTEIRTIWIEFPNDFSTCIHLIFIRSYEQFSKFISHL